jgi:hypothetical protein
VLQEIESHHGSSEVEIHSVLQQLFETDFPGPGEEITISYKTSSVSNIRNSVNMDDTLKCKTMPDLRRSNIFEPIGKELSHGHKELSGGQKELSSSQKELANSSVLDGFKCDDGLDSPKFLDLENNNGPMKILLSMENQR